MTGKGPDLLMRLRSETAEPHRRLEDGLALLAPVPGPPRLLTLLERFHGFHAVYEAAASRVIERDVIAPRFRLRLLEQDLLALGAQPSHIAGLPQCHLAHWPSISELLGAFYVMEGSTLGGKVISKSLRSSVAWPAAGLAYFDPYAERTGQMWQEARRYLWAKGFSHNNDEIVRGANRTFAMLYDWLQPAFGKAA